MPSSCDSSESGSPSLLNVLQQYRFTKQEYHPSGQQDSRTSRHEVEFRTQTDSPPAPSSCRTVPETPENARIKAEQDSDNSHDIGYMFTYEDECYNSENDMDPMEVDVYTDKEKSLRRLLFRFPHKDLMQLQDILAANDWSVPHAIAQIEGRPLPPPPPPVATPAPPQPASLPASGPAAQSDPCTTLPANVSSPSAEKHQGSLSFSSNNQSVQNLASESNCIAKDQEDEYITPPSPLETKAAIKQSFLMDGASSSSSPIVPQLSKAELAAHIKIEPPSPPDLSPQESELSFPSVSECKDDMETPSSSKMSPCNNIGGQSSDFNPQPSSSICSSSNNTPEHSVDIKPQPSSSSASSLASLRAYRKVQKYPLFSEQKPKVSYKKPVVNNNRKVKQTAEKGVMTDDLEQYVKGLLGKQSSIKTEVQENHVHGSAKAAGSKNKISGLKHCSHVPSSKQSYNKVDNPNKRDNDHDKLSGSPDNSLKASKSSIKRKVDTKVKVECDESPVKKMKPKRRKIEAEDLDDSDGNEYHNVCVYDSEDSDAGEELSPARQAVVDFLQTATPQELMSIPKCSKKKVENIIEIRPLSNWSNLVQKLEKSKYLTPDLLNGVRQLLNAREVITRLMKRCLRISEEIGQQVEDLLEQKHKVEGCIKEQPKILNERMCLAPYQMLGLNWLVLMHNNELNGILADEMGLGKTVQAIAFLAYLYEQKEELPHLIVVPSSTMDNWLREFQTWCPSLNVFCYHGSQELRRELRMQILNDEIEDLDVIVTTYNMVTTSPEDRSLFKKLQFHYVIFDEAHMLKNMASQRYQSLMKIRAKRRLLLTGTPLQNNLVELMSLLIFVMPNMFHGKVDEVKQMFSGACKSDESRSQFERKRIEHAKRIMRPFFLRRLKSEVLQQLPKKTEEIKICPFVDTQKEMYERLVAQFSREVQKCKDDPSERNSGVGMMCQLRKAANHPLLLRNHYTDEKLQEMAKLITKEPSHQDSLPSLVLEDMQVMSDYELHRLCHNFQSLSSFKLAPEIILHSGKFKMLESLLPGMKERGDRVLIFSQFTMMLDIMEEYMSIKNYRYIRLDGTTPVAERQMLIDMFNNDEEIFIFLLSTRAGGLGINLTAANVVLLHDIDFNPYNDKQAEDRCHRVGQMRQVTVMRLISENSIDEAILRCAEDKLKLEKDLTAADQGEELEEQGNVAQLLKSALGL